MRRDIKEEREKVEKKRRGKEKKSNEGKDKKLRSRKGRWKLEEGA
jgi:hypothetical protein